MSALFIHRNMIYRAVNGPRNKGHQHSGFTLPELLIVLSLTLLLLGLICAFLVPTMRAAILGSTRAEMQQEALRAMNRITQDLLLSAACGVSLSVPGGLPGNGPARLGIARIENVDHTGRQIWEQSLIAYSWQGPGNPLVRKVWNPSLPPSLSVIFSPGYPCRLGDSELASIAAEPKLQEQILARDVSEFLITSTGTGSSVSSPVDISITITRKAATGRKNPEVFELKRSITLRAQL
jgi:prepilin-type N-terminal cleavage/methylation domain-containing protein